MQGEKQLEIPANTTAENHINELAVATSLEESKLYTLPVSMKLSGADENMKTDPKAVLPGAVAESSAMDTTDADKVFKGNQNQRKIKRHF